MRGAGEIISPAGVQGQSPCIWRAFTEANLRSKLAPRATICAPQGHALGGRSPTFTLVESRELANIPFREGLVVAILIAWNGHDSLS